MAEDEDSIRELNEIVLKSAGHEVISTKDGEECLGFYFKEMTGGRKLDLVITDLRMPKKDGVAVVREILTKYPDQRIMIATAYSKDIPDSLGELIKKVKILRKPFELDELVSVVGSIK